MATARAYDAYQDTGLAFSEDEIREYDSQVWAQERVERLGKIQLVLMRKAELTDSKPKWWDGFAKRVAQIVGWYCVAMEVPKPPTPTLPDPHSAEGKRLTIQAQELDEDDALGKWRSSADKSLRFVVTIGRACGGNRPVSGWKKKEVRLSNRLANCVMREVQLADKMEEELASKGMKNDS